MKYETLNKISFLFLGLSILSLIPYAIVVWFGFIQFGITTLLLLFIGLFFQIIAYSFGD
jgi:hypothetical protein